MDWSYAGYMHGDYEPPVLPTMVNVKVVSSQPISRTLQY